MDEKNISKNISNYIKIKRQESGKTMTAVAADLGISRSQLYRIEEGTVVVSVQTLIKLAEYYDSSLDDILSYRKDDKEQKEAVGGKIDQMLFQKSEKTKELVYKCSALIAEYDK